MEKEDYLRQGVQHEHRKCSLLSVDGNSDMMGVVREEREVWVKLIHALYTMLGSLDFVLWGNCDY